MFGPPIPLPLPVPLPMPVPLPLPLPAPPGMTQAIENAVGDAIGSVLGGLTGRTPEGKKDLAIQLPDGRGGRVIMPDGVITTDQFREFAQVVGQAFQAVRQDMARLKSLAAANAARDGLYGGTDEENGRAGGIDPMTLILLLRDKDGRDGGAPMDTTTLLLLLMSEGGLGNGNGKMDALTLLLALGKL